MLRNAINKTVIPPIPTGSPRRHGPEGTDKVLEYRWKSGIRLDAVNGTTGGGDAQAMVRHPSHNRRRWSMITASESCDSVILQPLEKAPKSRNFRIPLPLQERPKMLDKVPGPRGNRVRTGVFRASHLKDQRASNSIG